MTEIWDKIRRIKGKPNITTIPIIIESNKTINDPKQIADILAETYAFNSSNENFAEDFLPYKNTCEQNKISITPDQENPLNKPITLREIQNAIKELKSNKSPGPDQIPFEFLKNITEETTIEIQNIFNYMWQTNSFPE